MELLKTENVVKQYAAHKALDEVSINVPEQSIYGLLGPNGAGKTSLIRIINQITAPDSGMVFIRGEKLKPAHCEIIGYLPEERGLYKKMKVGEQAMYLCRLKGLKAREAEKKLREWFDVFDIAAWWNKKVEELSKGMQQKIQFIVTVLHQPQLLIFDEPFSGFDPINANLIKTEILKLKKNGSTIIFSTHNMSSVEELCDNIALINNSKKILEGNVNEIRRQYKSDTYMIECKEKISYFENRLQQFEIIDTSLSDSIQKYKIKIIDNSSPRKMLQEILQETDVISFNEQIPSMNDIFIRTVQHDSSNNN